MFESLINKPQFENLGNKLDKLKIIEGEMKCRCIDIAQKFKSDGRLRYANSSVIERHNIANEFCGEIQEAMGVNAPMQFKVLPEGEMGSYSVLDGAITLNYRYLENPDSTDLLDTIIHESRHAYQLKTIENSDLTDTPQSKVDEWRDNIRDYIRAECDPEGYFKQPIEVDADSFAKEILAGAGYSEYLTNVA